MFSRRSHHQRLNAMLDAIVRYVCLVHTPDHLIHETPFRRCRYSITPLIRGATTTFRAFSRRS